MTERNLSISFLGCGNMGRAMLQGLLDALNPLNPTNSTSKSPFSFTACTATETSARSLIEELGRHQQRVRVLHGENKKAIEGADVVILGIKPYMAAKVLEDPDIREALKGKFVISMLAGIDVATLRQLIIGEASENAETTHVAKAIPNIAARYRQSITVLEESTPALPEEKRELLQWIFDQVGRTKFLPTNLVNVGTVLNTAFLSTLSIPLEGLLDGSVAQGLKRKDAFEMAAQGVRGFAAMLENGLHPAIMREDISSPRGCTIQTLMTVEKAATRATFAQALINGVEHLEKPTKK
ncbi:hypothetical protein FSARC_7302 [Fusarium sarcochroum]|uniref:Pyrroline-5-carboxylate reductase n=1 Tax=Fusarium sarcochroum TaxID=1208366 RepID=A0A8H4TVM3_9HYPO|nr:hypothetical protein FSARC_7302 [Fusarium sarcochroum]